MGFHRCFANSMKNIHNYVTNVNYQGHASLSSNIGSSVTQEFEGINKPGQL